MTEISSRNNINIKQYVKLKDSKKERLCSNQFVVEGLRLSVEAVLEKVSVITAFFTQSAVDKNENDIELISKAAKNAYLITQDVAKKMSDTISPQGVFLICEGLDKSFNFDTIRKGENFLALCNIQDPGNMGTIIRTAEALGIDGIIVTQDCCDLFNPKVIRSTMGSLFRTKFLVVDDIVSFIQKLNESDVSTIAAVVSDTALDFAQNSFKSPKVIFLGNEGNGLDDEVINTCKYKATIKMKGNAESLNASIAAAIIMWIVTN